MDALVLKYIPKGKREAIYYAYHDSDGYWISLNEGWHVDGYCAERTIHEDTISELRKWIPNIRRD